MRKIRETITGMVFEGYQPGDIPQLERVTSVYDKITHKSIPTAGFALDDGFATYKFKTTYLKSITAGTPYNEFEIEHIPMELGEPTNQFRSNIKLLKSQKQVSDKMMNGNVVFLNIPTASGKTVITVDFIAKLQVKTLIICFKKKILSQWFDTFKNKTDIDPNRVKIINTSKYFYDIIAGDEDPMDTDIWLATPNVITSFCTANGWDMLEDLLHFMGVGFKVIDEAHRCFGATIKINAHTSIRTLYLSADCNQANTYIRRMYFDSLRDANVIRYDQETMNDLKHITCVHYEFNSHPSDEDIMVITNTSKRNKYHWDHFAYTKYELKSGALIKNTETIINEVIKSEANIKDESGKPYKILVLTNMIEAVDEIYHKLTRKITSRSVSRYHTKMPKEEFNTYLDADIIVSTYQAFGEGVDVVTPCIRHVISTCPVDMVMANQSAGRCRPIKGVESFYWMLVDNGFEYCRNCEVRVTRYLANAKIGKITLIEAG